MPADRNEFYLSWFILQNKIKKKKNPKVEKDKKSFSTEKKKKFSPN